MALQLDHKVSFSFERLFLPNVESPEFEIDLTYKDKKNRLKYPCKEPLVLNLDNCFTCDNKLEILILLRESATRLKKIAKGTINIYKKYFNFTKKYKEEKWVYLDLFNPKGTENNQNTLILQTVSSTGKIYMKVALLNPPLEEDSSNKIGDSHTVVTTKTATSVYSQALKNNLNILDKTKENIKSNKTEKFRSISENTNEFLRNLKNKKIGADEYIVEEVEEPVAEAESEPEDGLSDVEESCVDGNETEQRIELGKLNPEVDLMVNRLREVYASMGDELIPKTKEEIKQFIRNMYNQIDGLATSYSLNVNTVAEINKKIRFQAKNYYERYKEIKALFDKERRELKSKKTLLDYELTLNNEENLRLKTLYNDVKNELLFFRARLGVKIENDPPRDFLALSRLLKETNEDMDMEGLDDQDKNNLNRILEFYNLKEFTEKKGDYAQNGFSKKSETVHFSDNEENDDILNNHSHREEINVLVSENVLLFNKINKSKETIKYNHLKDDEYEFNGVHVKLSVIDNQVLVLDKQNNWISLLEFLSTTFPLVTTNSSSGSNKKQKVNSINSKTNTSIQSQLEKIKEEKQKLLSSMNNHSQSAISRSKSPILVHQKKLSSN